MPTLSRWSMRAAMFYLIGGMMAGALYWAQAAWSIWTPLAYLSPIYIHMLVVGWLTQLIYGVIYWMFPVIRKDNLRGDPRPAWAVFVLLNVGLLMRIGGEPWRAASPNEINSVLLVVSAIVQTAAGLLYVLVTWPRVREKMGR